MMPFHTLSQIFSYQPYCPLCKSCTAVFPGEVSRSDKWGPSGYHRATLTFYSGGSSADVDIDTGMIIDWRETRQLERYYTIGGDTASYSPSRYAYANSPGSGFSSSGIDIFRLTMGCQVCHKYQYLIQVHLSFSERRFRVAYLNSESISFEETNGVLYEINNNYCTGKTEYIVFTRKYEGIPDGTPDGKICQLPLIPLNLRDPAKTLHRVKTLLVFS